MVQIKKKRVMVTPESSPVLDGKNHQIIMVSKNKMKFLDGSIPSNQGFLWGKNWRTNRSVQRAALSCNEECEIHYIDKKIMFSLAVSFFKGLNDPPYVISCFPHEKVILY